MPLVSAPWRDDEGLFTAGEDFLVARDGAEMRRHLRTLINDRDRAEELAAHGHRTKIQHHTCAHHVDELATICRDIGLAINGGAGGGGRRGGGRARRRRRRRES